MRLLPRCMFTHNWPTRPGNWNHVTLSRICQRCWRVETGGYYMSATGTVTWKGEEEKAIPIITSDTGFIPPLNEKDVEDPSQPTPINEAIVELDGRRITVAQARIIAFANAERAEGRYRKIAEAAPDCLPDEEEERETYTNTPFVDCNGDKFLWNLEEEQWKKKRMTKHCSDCDAEEEE